MGRGDAYLSSSTKIIKIGGFTAKILGDGGNHPLPPFGRRVTKIPWVDEGVIKVLYITLQLHINKKCKENKI